MVSLDLSTTTLNSLGISLMPSKWKHSISHKVESFISLLFSLKWAKWLSYSLGIGTTSSLKQIGIGSVSSTPCASFGEGKIPCSPFLTLSPSRLDAIRWASSLPSMVEGKIPCSTVLGPSRSSGGSRLMVLSSGARIDFITYVALASSIMECRHPLAELSQLGEVEVFIFLVREVAEVKRRH